MPWTRQHSEQAMAAEVSHGRGGAGNIMADKTPYVDGEVVRAGVEGSHGDGAYSAGRGGAGNIADAHTPPTQRSDGDIVPEAAMRPSQEQLAFHTGRGGAGNEHCTKDDTRGGDVVGHGAGRRSLVDKMRQKLLRLVRP
ncbi:hypothetical protein CDD81_2235 [Ophiocordyceps australis]|uniref:Uncharacterized protein n=1 Tax=Ophiocordyceps australis TaxID=1399860 RepID=A0A2C5Y7J0_9HYPO|nr:hypothetical protein CDD81_2235 [Ophiocordyceps australis]